MELEQIVELIDRVSASELDSFCLEQNGMRLSLKKKQPRKQTDPETQSTLVQLQKQSESPQEQSKQMSPVELTGTEPTKNRAYKNGSLPAGWYLLCSASRGCRTLCTGRRRDRKGSDPWNCGSHEADE